MGFAFISPMQPVLADQPPEGDQWQHEIKYDGYRTQLLIDNGEVRAITRGGHDWTSKYRPIAAAAGQLDCMSAILDGEVIVQDEHGRSDFHNLRLAIEHRPQTLIFMAFDLMHIDGRDVRSAPLEDRRARLQNLLKESAPSARLQFSDHVVGQGADLFEVVDNMGLEGIVSKKRTSRYRSGNSRSWLKIKCWTEDVFTVVGTAHGNGPPTVFLAREVAGHLLYAGSAMMSLGGTDRQAFWAAVDALSAHQAPVTMPKNMTARWVAPGLRVSVRYLKGSDKLRHATISGVVEP